MQPAAEIDTELVGAQVIEDVFEADVGTHQAGAGGDVRPHAHTGLAADGNANDEAAHQCGHARVDVEELEVFVAFGQLKEIRRVVEVDFEPEDAAAHCCQAAAEVGALLECLIERVDVH